MHHKQYPHRLHRMIIVNINVLHYCTIYFFFIYDPSLSPTIHNSNNNDTVNLYPGPMGSSWEVCEQYDQKCPYTSPTHPFPTFCLTQDAILFMFCKVNHIIFKGHKSNGSCDDNTVLIFIGQRWVNVPRSMRQTTYVHEDTLYAHTT